eukprot:5400360-Prymnesium_polylepis.1
MRRAHVPTVEQDATSACKFVSHHPADGVVRRCAHPDIAVYASASPRGSGIGLGPCLQQRLEFCRACHKVRRCMVKGNLITLWECHPPPCRAAARAAAPLEN